MNGKWKRYPAYRESGVGLLLRIPVHWQVKKLKHLASYATGAGIQTGPFGGMLTEVTYADSGEFKVYGQENILGDDFSLGKRWLSRDQYLPLEPYRVSPGDFLFTRKGSIGGCSTVPATVRPGIMDSDTIRLRIKAGIVHPPFLLCAFKFSSYLQAQVQETKRGAVLSGLNSGTIGHLYVAVPDYAEQHAIAAFLDRETAKIDALVAKKERLIELLQEKRTALISHAVTRGLNPNAPLRDSGIPWIGQIPAHWETRRLKSVLGRIDQGWSPQCSSQPAADNQWGVLKTGCTNGGIFDPLENKALPEGIEPPRGIEVKNGDILMSRASGSPELVGSVAIVHQTPSARLLLSDKTFRLVVRKDSLLPVLLVRMMGSPIVRHQISLVTSGAEGLANTITKADIYNLVLPVPPASEQSGLSAYIDTETAKLDALITKVRTAIDRLQEYRTALISAAVTGQIDVRSMAGQGA